MKKMISLLLAMMLILSICPTNVEAAVPKEDVITPQASVNMYCPYCKAQGNIIDQFLDITSGIYCYVMECSAKCDPNGDKKPTVWYYTFPINTIYGLEQDECEHE